MKITWLGQAGLLFENENLSIMIDPYLSDSCKKINPRSFRRQPINEKFTNFKPDVLITTHYHMDHYDIETVPMFVNENSEILFAGPESCFREAIKLGGVKNRFVIFNPKTSWTEKGVKFTAVKAEHSEPYAIGVIIEDQKNKYYITGDTLYNEDVIEQVPSDIDVIFVPVNGVGNNMNFADAKRFIDRVGAKKVVPLHLGMLDDRNIEEFQYKNVVTPKIYEQINL